jgi:hypothetical protein
MDGQDIYTSEQAGDLGIVIRKGSSGIGAERLCRRLNLPEFINRPPMWDERRDRAPPGKVPLTHVSD